jgi:hypothetical protein
MRSAPSGPGRVSRQALNCDSLVISGADVRPGASMWHPQADPRKSG